MVRRKSLLPLLFIIAVPFASTVAQDPKEIKFKSRDLEKVKAELNQKKEERERLQRESEELKEVVRENQSKIKTVETSLIYTKQKNWEVAQKLASTKNQHDQLLASLSDQKSELQSTYKTYYVASLLTSPDHPTPTYARQIIHARTSQLVQTKDKSKETRNNLNTLVETQQVIRGEVVKQESKLSSIRAGVEDKERLLNKKKSRQEMLESEMKELQQTAEELASLIDVLRSKAKEEAAAQKEERRIKQVTGQSPIARNSLPWPVAGKITTRFGRQQHPKLATTFVSNGIVIASDVSQQVLAVADGKVLYAGEFMSYGPMTVVEHPGDWYTVYGQMTGWNVEKGQIVKAGDKMGEGRPKTGGGYETYFELRFYGKSTDPMPWLERRN